MQIWDMYSSEDLGDKESCPALVLALLGIDTLKHMRGRGRIMGEWKWVEL